MSIVLHRNTGGLPYDIWYSIFKEFCLPTNRGFEGAALQDRYRAHATPITISHVCKAFRSLAISTPSLWTRISLRIGDNSAHDKGVPHVELMDLFLRRSRDLPLDVTLSVGAFDLAKREDEHRFLLKLFANAKRWKNADLELDAEWIDQDAWFAWFQSVLQGITTLEVLESLNIRVSATEHHYPGPGCMTLPVELWTASPSLTHLAISVRQLDTLLEEYEDIDPGDYMGWASSSMIPYAQITHLLLEGGPSTHISWLDIGEIFSTAPNIVVCFIEGICATPASTLDTPVVLQYLIHLYLEASGLDGTFEALTPGLNCVLTAPSLKTLALANGDEKNAYGEFPNIEDWKQEPYTHFITRSSCSLDELRFFNLQIPFNTFDDLLSCMRLSPTLRVLHFDFDMVLLKFRAFSDKLEERRNDASQEANDFILCPLLHELGLLYWDEIEESDFRDLGLCNERFLRLLPNELTGSGTTTTGTPTQKFHVVQFPDPYYVKNVDNEIDPAIRALRPVLGNSRRLRIIHQHYRVLHTTRRSLWNRFRNEKGGTYP